MTTVGRIDARWKTRTQRNMDNVSNKTYITRREVI